MNNKGNAANVIIVGFVLFVVLILGMVLSFGTMVIDWTADEIVGPLTNDLGVINGTNISEISQQVIIPANNIVQSFDWLVGIVYIMVLLAMFGFAFAFRVFGDKWLAVLFVCFMIILIMASIFISNIYEEFYNENTEVGTRLKEQTLMSWLVLYSPAIFTVIGFIAGIIMFTGDNTQEFA